MTSLVPTSGPPPQVTPPHPHPETRPKMRPRCNSLWSIWYGVSATGVQALLIAACMRRFSVYASLPWPPSHASPRIELNAYLGLVGVATLLLPFFLVAAIFKVGNLANDGFKLGHQRGSSSLQLAGLTGGGAGAQLWRHGGPTAPFLHLAAAFCLLLPKLVIEAKLIETGFLPKSDVWRTELDSLLPHRAQLVVLDFVAGNSSLFPNLPLAPPTPAPPDSPLATLTTFSLGSVSPEFLNYAAALVVYAVRYPAVFWRTNKCFGTLFSVQLVIGAIHSLVTYNGVSVLYKIQICYGNNPTQGLLLDATITLALYALSGILVLCSSLVLYLHGYCKFSSFVNRERSKRGEITVSREPAWGYFPHCAALCVLIAAAVVYAPLLHDSAIVYRGTLDTSLLACVLAAIGHLFLWVVTWLMLTVKRRWAFKLRVTVARAALRSARSIKLVTDLELRAHGDANAPLLVVGNGRTYTVNETSPKKAIMAVLQRTTLAERRANKGGEEQVYWLRPSNKQDGRKSCNKHKVTFDDATCRRGRGRGDLEDDGDYATLREPPGVDAGSDENLLLASVQDDSVTYASANSGDLLRPLDESPASSILLLPDPSPALGPQCSVTPRMVRRADSGVRMDDPLPRSESVSPESAGVSPPEHCSSETSSGVHSNSSAANSSALSSEKRCSSVDDVTCEAPPTTPWKSYSLQRGVTPPTPQYGFTSLPPITPIPEATVVIRRKQSRPKTTDLTQSNEPFERSTNMRMTSFTDLPDSSRSDYSDPPYSTQQQLGFCHSFPRGITTCQGSEETVEGARTLPTNPENLFRITENLYIAKQQALKLCQPFPRHTTIPTHHNGVRLFPEPLYARRGPLGVKYCPLPHPSPQNVVRQERDSANYSASSGDSDSCLTYS